MPDEPLPDLEVACSIDRCPSPEPATWAIIYRATCAAGAPLGTPPALLICAAMHDVMFDDPTEPRQCAGCGASFTGLEHVIARVVPL